MVRNVNELVDLSFGDFLDRKICFAKDEKDLVKHSDVIKIHKTGDKYHKDGDRYRIEFWDLDYEKVIRSECQTGVMKITGPMTKELAEELLYVAKA